MKVTNEFNQWLLDWVHADIQSGRFKRLQKGSSHQEREPPSGHEGISTNYQRQAWHVTWRDAVCTRHVKNFAYKDDVSKADQLEMAIKHRTAHHVERMEQF